MPGGHGKWDEDDVIGTLVELEPLRFEQFIAELWERRGWETEVTDGSGDRGVDVIATQSFPYNKKALLQAKRYRRGNNVSGPELQKYASLKQRSGVDEVVVVTTSQFTEQALELHEEFNIKLVDGHRLVEIIDATSSEDLVKEFAGVLNECPSCNTNISEGDIYCTVCGEHLEPHRKPTIEITHSDETNLVPSQNVTETPNAIVITTKNNEIQAEISDKIGRELRKIMVQQGKPNDEARRIHREHIRFTKEDGQVVVEPLGTNPTRLNGQLIDKGEKCPVEPGDTIELSEILDLNIERFV